jgi:hypothetical protein
VEFTVDKVALGQVFSEYFGFPCQFSFHGLLFIRSTIEQIVAGISSGLRLTPPHENKKRDITSSFYE